jgi:hypothetical protein
MRAAHLRLIGLLALLPLVAACPGPGGVARLKPGGAPDQYDTLAAVLKDQDGFNHALEKLQGQFTQPPDPSNAAQGDADLRYGLSTRVEANRAGIVLTDRQDGTEYVLWAFATDVKDPAKDKLQVTANTAEGGGLHLELQAAGGELSVTLLARWVNARFLQVSREVLLGGLDNSFSLPAAGHRWELDGPWLPYRLVPGEQGPYGVVPDAQATGDWQTATYPFASMVPAVAAYDKTHGFLLASTDRAARDLSRVYDLGWRVDPKYVSGGQLSLTYRYFDGVKDAFTDPFLVSGLPVRDSIVLEPLELTAQDADPAQVEAQSREVIARLGELSRSFWFVPKPPAPVQPGSAVALQEWISQASQLDDMRRRVVGQWEAQFNEALVPDARLGVTGATGIGARDLGGGGVAAEGAKALKELGDAGLPTVEYDDLLHLSAASPYAKPADDWLEHGADKQPLPRDSAHQQELLLDIRLPEASAWLLRKTAEDLKAAPAVGGYALDGLVYSEQPCPSPAGDARLVSYPAAAAFVALQAAASVAEQRKDALLASSGGLSLAQPAFCNAYANGDGAFGSGFGSGAAGSAEPALPLANRLSNEVCHEVFGVDPWLTFGARSIGAQVLATTPHAGGYAILRAYDDQDGFAGWATNLRELRRVAGELQILYASPEKSRYCLQGERPAVYDKLVAVLPAQFSGAQSVWVAFHGVGGSVSVDQYNTLTVKWDGGQWTGRLPGGIWKVESPDPAAIKAGDAVLIKQEPIQLNVQQGMSSS